jgi:hypothetical protein
VRLRRDQAGALFWLYLAAFITATGAGAWFVCWAIFATRSIGLSAASFGAGVTIAGVVSLAVGAPIGYLADRVGVTSTLTTLVVVQGTVVLCFAVVHSFWVFTLVCCVFMTAERNAPAMRIALVCGLMDQDKRVQSLSSLRVVQSAGASLGAGAGTLILYLDTRPAFLALLYLYGGCTLIAALFIRRLPQVATLADRGVKRQAMVIRDRPYLVVTVLYGVLALNWGALAVGVPLWVVTHTDAPAWTVGVILALNTLAITLFQKRASRSSASVAGATRTGLLCVVPLIVACLLFAGSFHRSGTLAVVILIVAGAVHTVGEMLFVASSWGLAVGLTPDEAHGEYQGVFNTGITVAEMLAPAVMATLIVGWGVTGWFALAGLFLLGGAPLPAAAKWATRHPLRLPQSPTPLREELA